MFDLDFLVLHIILSLTDPSIEALLLQVSESTFAPVWDDPWHHTPLPGSIFDSPLWITSIPSAWYPKASKRGGVAKQQNARGKHQEGFGEKTLRLSLEVINGIDICDSIDFGGGIETSEHELTMKHGENMKNI